MELTSDDSGWFSRLIHQLSDIIERLLEFLLNKGVKVIELEHLTRLLHHGLLVQLQVHMAEGYS